jgi:hypothetical protein
MARTKGSVLSEEAKEKMRARRAVVRYLESLDAPAPPEPVADSALVEAELARIDGLLADPELRAPRRLQLLQRKRNVQAHGLRPRGRPAPSADDLINGFIRHAATYAADEHLSYEAFLDFGVPAEILDKANLPRSDAS